MGSSSKTSNKPLHTGRDCTEGNPPGTINAAFVLWATQLVRVHSDEFATGTCIAEQTREILTLKGAHMRVRVEGLDGFHYVFWFSGWAFTKILANHFRAFVERQKMLTTQNRLEMRSLLPRPVYRILI